MRPLLLIRLAPRLQADARALSARSEAVISCKECYACKSGCNNACSKLGFVGISGLGGGLSEYFLSPAAYLHRVPDDVSLRVAAMSEPLAVAAHAVRRSGFQKGQTALVLGAGPIGCFLVKVLKAQGASCVDPFSFRPLSSTARSSRADSAPLLAGPSSSLSLLQLTASVELIQ